MPVFPQHLSCGKEERHDSIKAGTELAENARVNGNVAEGPFTLRKLCIRSIPKSQQTLPTATKAQSQAIERLRTVQVLVECL